MKTIAIGDKPLMQITQEHVFEIAIMIGCHGHFDYWGIPEIVRFDNETFPNTVILEYESIRKEDGIVGPVITFFLDIEELSYAYENKGNFHDGGHLDIKVIKYLIEKGYDIPIGGDLN